jgi:hypothetical protein
MSVLRAAVIACLLGAIAEPPCAAQASRRPANRPPTIACSLPKDAACSIRERVAFTIAVKDADGDRVSARLVSGPEHLVLDPISNAPSGVTREALYVPEIELDAGRRSFVIEAWDSAVPPNRVRERFTYTILGGGTRRGLETFDFDGDGDLDVLGFSPYGDVGPVPDAGAFAVFDPAGAASRFLRTSELLVAEHPTPSAPLVDRRQDLCDVTGDGVVDLVLVHCDGVFVWFGGAGRSAGTWQPDALLRSTDPASATCQPNSLLLEDVTHDGIEDVILGAVGAGRVAKAAGEMCIFAGGPGLKGHPRPTATLRVPGAGVGDLLGSAFFQEQQLIVLGDVTGDGIRDLVAVSRFADDGATADVGAAYV